MMSPKRYVVAFLLLSSLQVPAVSHAEPPDELSSTDFTDQLVVEVAFEGLVRLSLDEVRYLVEQVEGEPYDPLAVRRSAELLFRLGQFDDVQARVAPVDGGLRLTFALLPSARIARIRILGARRLLTNQVHAALSRSAGDPYVQQDELRLAREVEQWIPRGRGERASACDPQRRQGDRASGG